MITVYIKDGQTYTSPLKYILRIIATNKSTPFKFVSENESAQLVFDDTSDLSIPINATFYDQLLKQYQYDHTFHLSNSPYILFKNGKKDYLATAFYLINSFQEYSTISDSEKTDQYGRFRYEKSLQHRFDCVEQNLVQDCFDQFCEEVPILKQFAKVSKQTKVFLSHDIDTIYGSFMQDGLWALKKGRIDIILKLILNEMIRKPEWRNMDQIMKIHSENDLKSCFFWLATKLIGENKVQNADYDLQKDPSLTTITSINGLHKSCYSTTLDEELDLLPFDTTYNRYHFLKFSLPQAWADLEKSRINFDASLGFAERFGFRNNYGLPFSPFNIQTNNSHSFVEVPLNIMDGSFQRYLRKTTDQTANTIISFIEKNKSNAILSILWHNTFFTSYKYKGYLEEYKKLILYLGENGIQSITPKEILSEYLHD